MTLAYPWAGETPRPRYTCTLYRLVAAYAAVQAQFAARMLALREDQP